MHQKKKKKKKSTEKTFETFKTKNFFSGKMSKNLANLYKQQDIQGTKTLSAPIDTEYAKNFSPTYAMPQTFKVPPMRTATVPSNYEDGPSSKPKSFPIVANGKPPAASPTKKVEKRKFDEDEDVNDKNKATVEDEDDVELSESANDDDEEENEDGEDDEDEENLDETDEEDEDQKAAEKIMLEDSKRAMANGKKEDVLLVHRIKENKRAGRPDKLYDISGSSNEEDDEDDEEEEHEDTNGVERFRVSKTPIENLLGEVAMAKIKAHMKKIDSRFSDFNGDSIWALNSFVVNLLTVKFPHMALKITSKTTNENARRMAELTKNEPEKQEVGKGFIGTQYYPLALAVRYGLPTAAVVKPINGAQSICAIVIDPFRTAQLKAFGDEAMEKKVFPKSSNIPPISMRRYAVYNGQTKFNKENMHMLLDESSMKAHETEVSQKPSESSISETMPATLSFAKKSTASFTFDQWIDDEMVTIASEKNLLVNDVSDIIRGTNVNMVIVPNDVLGSLFRRRTQQRLGRLMMLSIAIEDDEKSFASFLKLATFPRSAVTDAKIDEYILSGKMTKTPRDMAYAHLLFGFIRMNTHLNEYEAGRGKCVVENLRVQTPNKMGSETTSGIHLSINETPIRSLLRLNQNIVKLLNHLWKAYIEELGIEGKADFYNKRMEFSKKSYVEASVQFILSNDYESQKSLIKECEAAKAPLRDEFFVHDALLYSTFVLLPSA